jgi:Carboxypeptidase regulatory-like domain
MPSNSTSRPVAFGSTLEIRCRRFLSFATCLLGVLLLGGHFAAAQGIITGGITGSVTDQTGAVIPNATIKVTNEGTGTIVQATSNGQGDFNIPDLPIGVYNVTVTASGFNAQTLTGVHVVAGNQTPIKAALNLGKQAETIEVEGSASELINTESAEASLAIDSEQLSSIPVAGAIDNVTLMVPGVVMTHSDAFSNTNGVNFSANGERGRSNNSEIDGQTNNDDSIGGPSFFFSNQDALQEVQVITTDMTAQYGRNFGSVVNYITKSGTNTFHGSGFEYYMGSWGSSLLQTQKDPQFGLCPPGSNAAYSTANGCSLITVPRFVENRYGGTLGGPVLRNKLWLFGSTFWAHEYQASSPATTTGAVFPDATGLKELQADYPGSPAVAAMVMDGPQTIGATTTFGAMQIPVTDGTTVQSIEMAQYSRTVSEHVLDQEELGRLDYQATDKDRFYLRYAYQNNPWIPAWYLYFPTGIATGGYSIVTGVTYEVGGDWTHTFTPNLTNQLRYAFQQASIGFQEGGIPSCTFTALSTCSSYVTIGGGGAGFGYGYGSLFGGASLPQGRFVRVNQVQDNAQWTHGRHTILYGMEYDYQNSPWEGLPNITGTYNFSPGVATNAENPTGIPFAYPSGSTVTPPAGATTPVGSCEQLNPTTGSYSNACGNGFTGMLEDIGTLSLAEGNSSIPFKEKDISFYVQDDFKITSDMMLNLGLRYEYFGQSANLVHNASVAQQEGPNAYWDKSLPLSATTFPSVNPDYRNIEPRIGLAYTPSFAPKMVVHAGFDLLADPVFYNIFLNIAQSAPVVNSGVVNCNGIAANGPVVGCEPSGGWSYATVQPFAQSNDLLPTGGDPRLNPIDTVPANLRNPMAEIYTLGIQYQVAPTAVAEVRYVGNHTFDNFQQYNANPDILDVQSSFPNYGAGTSVCTTSGANGETRPNCNYNLVTETGNTAFLIYNALQTSLTVRNFRNWTGTASYTWSRAISNSSEIFSTGSGGNTSAYAQNPLNIDQGERGVDGNSYPNAVGIQLTYTEPWFHEQRSILGRLLGGFFLNNFYQYNSGQPFSPIQNSPVVPANSPAGGVIAALSTPGSDSYNPSFNPTMASNSFGDLNFASYYGNSARPILQNSKAPIGNVGINLGPGGYVDYVSGSPVSPSTEHWTWSNQYAAIAAGTPFPGVGRNILRGDSWNNLDASIGKNIKMTERVTMQITMNVFNVLNRAYYGTPDPNIEDSWAYGTPESFLSDYDDVVGGTAPGTAAGGGAYYAGFGNRNIEFSGHINF